MRPIPQNLQSILKSRSLTGNNASTGFVVFTDKPGHNVLPYAMCHINREEAACAQRSQIEIWNVNPDISWDVGYYSPDRTNAEGHIKNEWANQILPGKNIIVKMGYENDVVQTFKGCIDDVVIESSPDGYKIKLDCRDDAWKLLDAQVWDEATQEYYIGYADMDTSDIATDLFIRAGFKAEDITTLKSGIVLPEIEFQNCTWADALADIKTISGFESIIDEYGKVKFLFPTDMEPKVTNEQKTFNDSILNLDNYPIVSNSDVVRDLNKNTYKRDVDYYIDYKTGKMYRYQNGAIPENSTILASYIHAAYVFREGEDLFFLPYTISRRKQYGRILVTGDGCEASYYLPDPESRGVPKNKVLFVNYENLDTEEKCQDTANRLGLDMSRRYRELEFSAVGIPWIQIGDCIQIIESSTTISEIYRITSLDFEHTPDGLVMTGRCHYYGYSPL